MKRRGVALLCAVLGFLVIPASPALAHAEFLGSDPADGAVLSQAPEFAQLRFSEEVLLKASTVTLLQLGSGDSTELPLVAADGGATIEAKLPKLARGGYILRFVAIDPADLHKTVGTISFGIGVEAPPSQEGSRIDGSGWTVGIRTIADGLLLLGVGAVVVIVLAVRRKIDAIDGSTRLAARCLAATAIGWFALFLADVGDVGWQHADWTTLITGSDPGRRALVGLQLAVGSWWAARMLRNAPAPARWFISQCLGVIAGAFVATAAFGGHAGVGGNYVVGIVLRTLHYGSLGIWIGAVAAAWLLGRKIPELRALWPEVSRLAALGLAVTGATGLLLSGRVVATVTALLTTTYGRAIVGKLAVLAVLAIMGLMAARRVAGGKAPARVPLELAVACVALALASLLASSAPARGEQFSPVPPNLPQVVTGDVRDLTVSASIEPGRPGPNLVQVRVLDTRRPPLGVIESVVVRLVRGDGATVAEREGVPDNGVLEWADIAIDNPGSYRIEVAVARPTVPVPVFVSTWQIDRRPAPRAETVLSTRSWAPIAAMSAAVWLVIVVLVGWRLRRKGQASNR